VVVLPLHFKFLDLLLLELLSEEEAEEESDLLLMCLEKIVFCSSHTLHDMKKRISRSIFGRKETFFSALRKHIMLAFQWDTHSQVCFVTTRKSECTVSCAKCGKCLSWEDSPTAEPKTNMLESVIFPVSDVVHIIFNQFF
jgi:hypothetical protein